MRAPYSGGMARDAKRPEDRQRRNRPAVIDAGAAPAVPAPGPPEWLTGPLADAWRGLWCSPVAQLLDPVSDRPAVERLFRLYLVGERLDERLAAVAAGEVDDVSLEQAAAARVRVASECRLLEGQLGLSPRSRLALGLALLAGRRGGGGADLDALADEVNDG